MARTGSPRCWPGRDGSALNGRRAALAVDVAVKAALIGLLLFAVARPDLPQFEGKAMTGRALAYPIATVLVPLGWWLAYTDTLGDVALGLTGSCAWPRS